MLYYYSHWLVKFRMYEYIILVFDVQMLFHLFVCTSVKVVYKMVSEEKFKTNFI